MNVSTANAGRVVVPEVLATLMPELRALTGHAMHGGLGFSVANAKGAVEAA